ncbi:hypothetical protein IV487_04445 [Enterococcus saccharolyticus]|uniref:Uncharacterized protein n=1 Tax=Candidatus Enterococcus willemsii TaxID=1857215 RepID=A0ABQ6YZE6_9ENTE|nr:MULTISPECIES: hypothetical protein [Enterococcus]KAF1303312.1 hypothetical protein BAU17_08795 [Enterococcus sp. CU12B]MCD5001720.1 hypothetical protein [Enterococcus saccharolyticus]
MLKFAYASLKYHRRATTIYIISLFAGSLLLFFFDSLQQSLPILLQHTEAFLFSAGYLDNPQILRQIESPTNRLDHLYSQVTISLFIGLLLFFTYLSIRYQKSKQQELVAWYRSGSSMNSWIRLNLAECLLPFGLILLIFSLVLIIFQNTLGNLLLHAHLGFFNLFGEHVPLEITEQSITNKLLVRVPTTNTGLVTVMQLSVQDWIHLFFTSLWRIAYTLGLLLIIINTLICSIFTYRRYHQWNNHSH